ncbi:MAG TPA: queuosine precursor transporter [Methanocorpusculum sp.]|nr:queuosine precursor transporter [Methanocorpusculum sp.]
MYKTNRNLILLTSIFVVSLVIANILAAKVVQIGFIEIPAAIILYPITFICTDVISEIWGKKDAQFAVRIGIIIQICTLIFIYAAILLPPAPYMVDFQKEYADVLGSTARFVSASLIAAVVSQHLDIFIFHKIKDRFPKYKWMRNNTTIISQLVDTTLFITIAFFGSVPNILIMIASQFVIKMLIAIADTPLFYYLTRHGQKTGPDDSQTPAEK